MIYLMLSLRFKVISPKDFNEVIKPTGIIKYIKSEDVFDSFYKANYNESCRRIEIYNENVATYALFYCDEGSGTVTFDLRDVYRINIIKHNQGYFTKFAVVSCDGLGYGRPWKLNEISSPQNVRFIKFDCDPSII